jgi:inner membrane protein
MPGLGHLVVGMAAGRLHAPHDATAATVTLTMVAYAALSAFPDVDVVAFALGIPYDAPFGHRGAFHSVTVALVLAVAFGAVAHLLGQPWLRTTLLACIVATSHGLLDTLTDGGEGIAVLWPLTTERYFAPWRPIPVAPILPTAWLSSWGARVVITELLLFLPLAVFALWPRRKR